MKILDYDFQGNIEWPPGLGPDFIGVPNKQTVLRESSNGKQIYVNYTLRKLYAKNWLKSSGWLLQKSQAYFIDYIKVKSSHIQACREYLYK